MPQVPVLSDNRVGTAARRPNYERPLDVSQQQRQTVLTLGAVQEATNLVEDRVAQDDALRTQAAITEEFGKFSAAERARSQGRNADGYTERVSEWWDKAATEYGEAVTPRAQRLVGQQLQRMRAASLADAAVHQEVQLNNSHVEALGLAQKALVNHSIGQANQAALTTGMAGAAQAARVGLAEVRANAAKFAATQGKPQEWVDAQVLAASTDVHASVIQALANTDPTAANAYYKEHKGQIDARLYDNLDKQLTAASAANDAVKAADMVWKSMGPKGYNDPVPLDKMEEKLRELFPEDAHRYKLAKAEMRERATAHNQAQAEFTATNKNGALAVFQSTNSLAATQKSPEYARLSAGEQLQVTSYITNYQASQLAKQEAALNRDEAAIRRQIARDMRAYAPAYNALSDPALLRGMTRQQVLALQTQIGPEYTKDLLARFDSISKSDDKFTEAKVDRESMDGILRDLGLDPTARKGDKAALAGETRRRMELAVSAAQQSTKSKMTREEIEEVMRAEAAKTVKVAGNWFGTDEVEAVTITPEQLARVVLPTGKAADALAKKLGQLYAASGYLPEYEPTQENLRRLYLRLSPEEGGIGSSTAKYIQRKTP